MTTTRTALAAIALAALATACSGSVSIGGGLDLEELESAIIETGDAQRADLAPFTADCEGAPTDVAAGDTFTCTAIDASGNEYPVTVTADDDEGNVSFEF